MTCQEVTPMFENYNPVINPAVFELDYGLLLKEHADYEADLKNQKSTLVIALTVAHYISPSSSAVAFSNQAVSEHMKSFGMDVIPILGDQLAEEEGVDEELGLILEHEADSQSNEFDELVDEIKLCLNQLGWKYDGWIGEVDQPHTIH